MKEKNTSRFYDLLLSFSQEPDASERRKIEKIIWGEFGSTKAVLALDMCGFSELSMKHGIVHYLSMVRRMQLTVKPIIESYNGSVVKFEADNCFAIFPHTLAAIRASITMNSTFDASNALNPEDLDIRISCGIDYGEILLVDNKDFFGNPVIRASKLGEDLAGPGEILVTKKAIEQVDKEERIKFKPLKLSISGIEIDVCSITTN